MSLDHEFKLRKFTTETCLHLSDNSVLLTNHKEQSLSSEGSLGDQIISRLQYNPNIPYRVH
jgi:hypothetical protein